ncbi:MAG: J domain-containing protein [Pirellulaceae bacterium]
MHSTVSNPHDILGVSAEASDDEIRQAYLARVREFPPDRQPDRFREIHEAYQLLRDPLLQAKKLFDVTRRKPDLNEVIANASLTRPVLKKLALLALGNRPDMMTNDE